MTPDDSTTTSAPGAPARTRSLGVEEELLLVDRSTGEPAQVAGSALGLLGAEGADQPAATEEQVEPELFRPQIEIATPPAHDLAELEEGIRRARRVAGEAVAEAGAGLAAVGAPPVGSPVTAVTPNDRYRRIVDHFGLPAREALVCAMHVHVGVEDREEGVRVLDGVRPWLPLLVALSANSPYWRGEPTGFSSWRSELWRRFPSTGAGLRFEDPGTYDEVTGLLQRWGAALDEGMVYLDARLSAKASTVELRVADVCTDVSDAVLVAAVARTAVEVALAHPEPGPGPWRGDLHRAAAWRAAREGVGGRIVHPVTWELAPVREVLDALLDLAGPAAADAEEVRTRFEHLCAAGGGAARQRARHESTGSVVEVVRDLVARTEASWD